MISSDPVLAHGLVGHAVGISNAPVLQLARVSRLEGCTIGAVLELDCGVATSNSVTLKFDTAIAKRGHLCSPKQAQVPVPWPESNCGQHEC